MQTSFSSATKLSEEHLYQYLLVVHPDSDVYEKIETEKQDFYNEYKEKIAIKTKPHITVANFLGNFYFLIFFVCRYQPAFMIIFF